MPWASTRCGRLTLLKLEGEKSSGYSMSLQITLGGKQLTFVRVVYLAQLSAANKYGWNLVTSHPAIPVLVYMRRLIICTIAQPQCL